MTVLLNSRTIHGGVYALLPVHYEKLSFDLIGQQHPRRSAVENTIAKCFADVYGAHLQRFMPIQLCMSLGTDIAAAVGIRCAENSPLFLERYLDEPIEKVASSKLGNEILRADVVEIGNLIAKWRGASQWLFISLTLLLCEHERPWVTFTATREVQKLLRRLNIIPIPLQYADGERLGEEKSKWGNYYQQNPTVMITHAPTAKEKMMAHLQTSECIAQLQPLVTAIDKNCRLCDGGDNGFAN